MIIESQRFGAGEPHRHNPVVFKQREFPRYEGYNEQAEESKI